MNTTIASEKRPGREPGYEKVVAKKRSLFDPEIVVPAIWES